MTRTLALELSPHGINVNALCPGPFATEINLPLLNDPEKRAAMESKLPIGRWGEPERTRAGRPVPGLRGVQLHDRRDVGHRRRLHGPVAGNTGEDCVVSDPVDWQLPSGFKAAAVKAGIKPSGAPDLVVIVAESPAVAAGTFTTNRVAAAPVRWCRGIVPSESVRAIVVNAGNANAATGEQGMANARRTAEVAAEATRLPGRPDPPGLDRRHRAPVADGSRRVGGPPGDRTVDRRSEAASATPPRRS